MAVAADRNDPAGPWHPIHPPWKADVGYRTALVAQNIMYGNPTIPVQGPRVIGSNVWPWDKSWGHFHYDMEGGACGVFLCVGITVKFDQKVTINDKYGSLWGYPNGFDIVHADGRTVQPATLLGLVDPYTIQLNATWTFDSPTSKTMKTLHYGWHDFPALVLYNSFGQPALPFNLSLVY